MIRKPVRLLPLFLVAAVCGAMLTSCLPTDPYSQIDRARSQYTVQAQGFYVDEQVAEPEEPAEGEPAMEGEEAATPAGEESGDGEEAQDGGEAGAEEEAPAAATDVEKDVVLDIVVQNEADQPLDWLTVELEHVDASGAVKDERRITIDVSGVARGTVGQFSERLEDVDYAEGDQLAVSVRSPIPEAERSEYREFDDVEG